MAEQTPPPRLPEVRRAKDFVSMYATNVQLELSVWDLKLIFGELDQHDGQEVIEQRISIRVPWIQAKLLSLFLQLNLAFHESTNGKITIPPYLLPQFPLPGTETTDPQVRALTELYHKKLEQFLADS
jgi:hypothetical protein